MQAQVPPSPHIGLWTRLEGFVPAELDALHTERTVVRGWLMRNTLHVAAAEDFVAFRALFAPVARRAFLGQFRRQMDGGALDERAARAGAGRGRAARDGRDRQGARRALAGPR